MGNTSVVKSYMVSLIGPNSLFPLRLILILLFIAGVVAIDPVAVVVVILPLPAPIILLLMEDTTSFDIIALDEPPANAGEFIDVATVALMLSVSFVDVLSLL